jgi:hypothetical protein
MGGKIGTFAFLVAVAIVSAGVFGALHNQLSYSVGPAYFTGLKFPQFAISGDTAPRLGAAVVGWRAGWWMGFLAALPVLAYGLVSVPSAALYRAGGLAAIGTGVTCAAFGALLGLAVGMGFGLTGLTWPYPLPAGIPAQDFIRAGAMHDGSYIGGLLGAVLAFWPMRRAARFTQRTTP